MVTHQQTAPPPNPKICQKLLTSTGYWHYSKPISIAWRGEKGRSRCLPFLHALVVPINHPCLSFSPPGLLNFGSSHLSTLVRLTGYFLSFLHTLYRSSQGHSPLNWCPFHTPPCHHQYYVRVQRGLVRCLPPLPAAVPFRPSTFTLNLDQAPLQHPPQRPFLNRETFRNLVSTCPDVRTLFGYDLHHELPSPQYK